MTEWRLAWTVARRELRGGARGFAVFLLCLGLGVAAVAGVGTLNRAVTTGLTNEGGRLLGGEVDLRLHNRGFSDEQRRWVAARVAARSEVLEMRAMARPVERRDKRVLVELKAVDEAYPLVGALKTTPASPLAGLLARRDGVWGAVADPGIMRRLGLSIGERVRVGEAEFQVRAALDFEPDRVATVVSFGPRLMVARAAMPSTGLVQPGSQMHFHMRLMLPPDARFEAWTDALTKRFPSAGWRLRGADEAAPGVRRFIERLTLFLTFVGLTVLLVGGIGVANAVGGYVEAKTSTIATLKCLGAPGRLVFRAYMLLVMAMAAAGTLAGLVAGWGLPALGVGLIGGLLPVKPVVGLYAEPLALAALYGLLVAFTFALWPIARARDVPAAALFRLGIAPLAAWPRRAYLVMAAVGILALAALVLLTAGDRYFASWFLGGAVVTLAALRLGAAAVIRMARRAKPRLAWLRLALANLHRPKAATVPVTLSLGLGLSVLVAVSLIQGNLSRQVSERLPEEAPAFFFIDIQPDQVARFDAAVTGIDGTGNYRRVPSLRGRIVKIKGVDVADASVAPESEWAVRGDRALTYAAAPTEDSKIIEGDWWPKDYAGPPIISLDAGLARGFGMTLGDTLTLNVLGRDIQATVKSLREIDWRSLRFDFAIIFAPGTLEGAPHSHIAAIEAPRTIEDAVERAATDRFQNVSAIRVREALEAAARILAGVEWAVRGTSLLTIVSGLIVLAGAIAAGHRRRIADAVIFKVLGASRRRTMAVFLAEYGLIGLLTGVVATAVGTLTAWAVVRFLMRSDWQFVPEEAVLTVMLALVSTLALGLVATWRALARRPMPFLRNE